MTWPQIEDGLSALHAAIGCGAAQFTKENDVIGQSLRSTTPSITSITLAVIVNVSSSPTTSPAPIDIPQLNFYAVQMEIILRVA